MAMANYSDLQTSIGNWIKDTTLTSVIPDFITLAEARFNRQIRTPEMEAVSTAAVSTQSFAVPTGFLEMRSIWLEERPDHPLDYFPPHQLKTMRANSDAGKPIAYTIIGESVYLAPAPGASYNVSIAYYGKIPALSGSNTTNWLLTSHPDLYLSASLAAAEAFGWNDERVGFWDSSATRTIDELNEQGMKKRIGANPQVRSLRAFS